MLPSSTAYGYVRFSTDQQKTGDSLRRQTQLAIDYVAKHGREFVHGVHDCYSLIRDWFKLERDIELQRGVAKVFSSDITTKDSSELIDIFLRDVNLRVNSGTRWKPNSLTRTV